jgi:hypothetical protein
VFKRRGRLTLRETLTKTRPPWTSTRRRRGRLRSRRRCWTRLPPKRHRVKRPVDGKPAAPYERDACWCRSSKPCALDHRVARRSSATSPAFFRMATAISASACAGSSTSPSTSRPGGFAEIEVKRDAKTKSSRSAPDSSASATIKAEGGIAGWAWSAESALAILP